MRKNTLNRSHDAIDAQAEREGDAIERLHAMLGTEPPKDPIQALREETYECLRRGLPLTKLKYAYRKQDAIVAWEKIVAAFKAGTPVQRPRYTRIRTKADAISLESRRLSPGARVIPKQHALKVKTFKQKTLVLKKLPADSKLSVSQAAALLHGACGFRTIYRMVKNGWIKSVPVKHPKPHDPHHLIPVGALRSYVDSVLAVAG